MENNLKDMGKLHFTDERKQELMKNVKENVNQNKAIKFSKLSKVSVIAASLALVSVTAYATGILTPVTDILAPFFGSSAAQTEIIEKIGRPIGASDTDKGVTITASAIIGDDTNACVIYTVTNKDGSQYKLPNGVSNIFFSFEEHRSGTQLPQTDGGRSGSTYSKIDEQGNLQIIEQFVQYDGLPLGETVTTKFNEMQYFDVEKEEIVTLVDGRWEFEYLLDYEDTSKFIEVNQSFEHFGDTATVESVKISPISISVKYQIDSVPSTEQAEHNNAITFGDGAEGMVTFVHNQAEIKIIKKDGTVIDDTYMGESANYSTGITIAEKGCMFDEIIPLDEILCITVGDIEVFLD